MKQFLLFIGFAVLLALGELQAQKVYMEGGKYILDLTEEAGMPEELVSNVSKTALLLGGSSTSNTVLKHSDNKVNGLINASVYRKLEIAPYNVNSSGGMSGVGTSGSWSESFNRCIQSTYDGGNWRLPTQRELMLIYIFRPALRDLGIGSLTDDAYLSATEESASEVWCCVFSDGNVVSDTKVKSGYARCVREIP